MEWTKDGYTISTDKTRLNVTFVHQFLSIQSYWAQDIPLEIVQKSIENALCFGIYHDAEQVGFARVITDFATIAYIGDVFVAPAHRGRGLSKWLVETMVSMPELQGFRRWLLATADAHTLYEKYGFQLVKQPECWMEKCTPNVYKKDAPAPTQY